MSLYSRQGSRGGRETISAAPPRADLARDGRILHEGHCAAMQASDAVPGGAGCRLVILSPFSHVAMYLLRKVVFLMLKVLS